MVKFCLTVQPRPCLGLSTKRFNDNVPNQLNLQAKGKNVSVDQLEWNFLNGTLRPFLRPTSFVTVDKNGYLVISSVGSPVSFENAPFFSSRNGSLCVTPMKCLRNPQGFCSSVSSERANKFANGAVVKLLPCLDSSPLWDVVLASTDGPTIEYEEETKTPSSLAPSSLAPSSLSPTVSPSFSPTYSAPTVSPSFSPESSWSPPPSFMYLDTPSPTTATNESFLTGVQNNDAYAGLSVLIVVLAIPIVYYVNVRKKWC